MKKILFILFTAFFLFNFPTLSRAEVTPAKAELINTKNEKIGTVQLTEKDGAVQLAIEAKGLTPGAHGIHIHNMGKCTAPDFTSAGPHFNPDHKKHGLNNPQGSHAGDLPNLQADSEGNVKTTLTTKELSLDADAPHSVFQSGGTAVIIHAGPDDEKSDPAGNSGGRIACGVIEKA